MEQNKDGTQPDNHEFVEMDVEFFRRTSEQEAALNLLLRSTIQPGSLFETLSECLDTLFSVSWVSLLPKGGVFLVGNQPDVLELFVTRDLSPELHTLCAKVPFGNCLCGRAALTREIIFKSCVDDQHEIRFEGMGPHGHYCVPILDGEDLLGVIVLYLPHGHTGNEGEITFLRSVADVFAMVIKMKAYEAQLIEASRLSEILEESLNEIYICDLESLKLSRANRGALLNLGYSADELQQLTPFDLNPEYTENTFREMITPLLDGREKRLHFETVNKRKDGSVYPVEVNLQYDYHGPPALVAIINDLSETRSAEKAQHAAEEVLRHAIEALPDGFALYDADDRLQTFNKRYFETFSFSQDAIRIGSSFEEILRYGLSQGQFSDAVGREEEWLSHRLAAHRSCEGHLDLQLKNEDWVRVLERRTPNGGIVGLRVDITELKKQQADLELARQKAEAASQSKSEFLATMSHEIRTPLNGVIGMAQLLQEELKNPEQIEKIRIIRESGEALGTILDDILQVSRMDAGKLELEDGVVDPVGIAQKIKELHDLSADEKGLNFDVFVSSSVHAAYRGDAGRIVQILHNLVSNSIKFAEQGDISVVIRPQREGGIVLEVTDAGIGMTPDQLDRIHEDFAQADSSITRRFGGTGLGIGIVKRLSHLMGGTFEIQSELGKGTRATVYLPLEEMDPM